MSETNAINGFLTGLALYMLFRCGITTEKIMIFIPFVIAVLGQYNIIYKTTRFLKHIEEMEEQEEKEGNVIKRRLKITVQQKQELEEKIKALIEEYANKNSENAE